MTPRISPSQHQQILQRNPPINTRNIANIIIPQQPSPALSHHRAVKVVLRPCEKELLGSGEGFPTNALTVRQGDEEQRVDKEVEEGVVCLCGDVAACEAGFGGELFCVAVVGGESLEGEVSQIA